MDRTWICHLAVLQELCVVRVGRDSDLSVAGGSPPHRCGRMPGAPMRVVQVGWTAGADGGLAARAGAQLSWIA